MSIVSALCKGIGSLIFTLFLLVLIMSYGLAQLTSYESLEPTVMGLAAQQMPVLSESQFATAKALFTDYCQRTGSTSFNVADIVISMPNATIKCADVASITSGNISSAIGAGVLNYIYYKNYSCDFISCFSKLPEQERPFVILSALANAFFAQVMIYAIIGIIVGLALIVVATRKLYKIFRAVGIEMIISGVIAYALMLFAKNIIPAAVAASASVGTLVSGFFGTMTNGFLAALIMGIVLVGASFVMSRGERIKKSKRGKQHG